MTVAAARSLLRRGGSAVGRSLALAVGGLTAYNAAVVVRLRVLSDRHDHGLVHDAIVGTPEGRPLRLAVLGDSSANGFGLADPLLAWPRQLADRIAAATAGSVEVRCPADRGARIRHVIELQVPLLADWSPDAVVVAVGANDVLGRRRRGQVERDMHELLDRLTEVAPGAAMFIGGPGNLGAGPAIPWPLSTLLGWQSRRVVEAQRRVAGERGTAFAALPPMPDDHFGPDGFHGGAAAHALAAELTFEALRPVLSQLA